MAGNSDNLRRISEESPRTLAELRRSSTTWIRRWRAAAPRGQRGRAELGALAAHRADPQPHCELRRGRSAFAGNGTEISETIGSAPEILDEATLALKELPSTLDELERLILTADRYKTGVPERLRQLATTLTTASPRSPPWRRTVNRKGSNNDLADLMAVSVAPRCRHEEGGGSIPARPAAATPLVGKTRAYTADIVGALTGLGYISANYDAAGHYARVSPLFNLFQLTGTAPNYDLVARSDFNDRLAGLTQTTNRCPGSAGPFRLTARRRSPTAARSPATPATCSPDRDRRVHTPAAWPSVPRCSQRARWWLPAPAAPTSSPPRATTPCALCFDSAAFVLPGLDVKTSSGVRIGKVAAVELTPENLAASPS